MSRPCDSDGLSLSGLRPTMSQQRLHGGRIMMKRGTVGMGLAAAARLGALALWATAPVHASGFLLLEQNGSGLGRFPILSFDNPEHLAVLADERDAPLSKRRGRLLIAGNGSFRFTD